MPIYEFRCPNCGSTREIICLSHRDNKGPRCQRCGGVHMYRILSHPAVIKIADEYDNLRKRTGCKGFECSVDGGKNKIPMWNRNKLD